MSRQEDSREAPPQVLSARKFKELPSRARKITPAAAAASNNAKTSNEAENMYQWCLHQRSLNASYRQQLEKQLSSSPFADLSDWLSSTARSYSKRRRQIDAEYTEAAEKSRTYDTNKVKANEINPSSAKSGSPASFSAANTSSTADKPSQDEQPAPAEPVSDKPAFKWPSSTLLKDPFADMYDKPKSAQSDKPAAPASAPPKVAGPFTFIQPGTAKPQEPVRTPVTSAVTSASSKSEVTKPATVSAESKPAQAPEAHVTASAPAPKPFAGFSFGTASSFGSATPPSASAKPLTSGFSFGAATSATPPKPSVGFGFGAAAHSTASPFGAPTTSPFGATSASTTSAAAPAASPFAFGTSGPFSNTKGLPAKIEIYDPSKAAASESEKASEDDGTPDPEATKNSLTSGGAGEENEETLSEIRAKLFVTQNGEASPFGGVTVLKLKKNTTTDKCRILGRSDTNGRVVLNFSLHKNLEIKVAPKEISFIGFNDQGDLTSFRGRIKPGAADEFAQAVKESVDHL
ncbi:uncharacterized protein L969DRAFT_17136 [Mixia osmundae IAM 14324]|uniref:uncharacterized protein n=1 Tax=Mixia osmundae (strain CBS 9802 / IAM 14324 / JCM 22182 / KY 12970) TaxID=764103 RepID=UPI0004A54738|nr:uncharacterized protein L969DRAFT_17136 [Mixia osmundae IAM 14324]KEI39201.1 hypothetical protein L969DRAFT_17136 [Mixia osmundae IAM 14324]